MDYKGLVKGYNLLLLIILAIKKKQSVNKGFLFLE